MHGQIRKSESGMVYGREIDDLLINEQNVRI